MIIRNSIYNLFGLGIPLIFAVLTIPALIDILGDERFGMLTLIWAIVSYFGLFDLGLSRALTLQLSRYLSSGRENEAGVLAWTALLILTGLGVIAGMILWLLAPIGFSYIKSSIDLSEQASAAFYMALALPFILLTTGFRGILESTGSFRIINFIRLPMGIFTFVGPLLVIVFWKNDLGAVSLILLMGRIFGCMAHAFAAYKCLPSLNSLPIFRVDQAKPLFSVGVWLTISNVIGPFMGYVDRFIIGVLISAAAVTYYAVPNEMITKLWIIPGALTSVLFPYFASSLIIEKEQVKSSFVKTVFWLFLVMFPISIFIFSYSFNLLELWIGNEFAEHSYIILRWFSLGIFINCMAHIPYTLIQSSGNTRLTAFIHLLQLPIFIALLYWLVSQYGGVGAAAAWCFRVIFDALLMYYFGLRIMGLNKPSLILKGTIWAFVSILCFALIVVYESYIGGVISMLVAFISVWFLVSEFRKNKSIDKKINT